MILIVDYGGQYVHRIWRSLSYLNVESEVIPFEMPLDEVRGKKPSGLILSGGPYSVYEDGGKLGDYGSLIELGCPVLGICLGHQIIAHYFGGKVGRGASGEYAEVEITVLDEDELFRGLGNRLLVWESHRDEVSEMPKDFVCLARSDVCGFEAIKHKSRSVYGVQFHPEVHHTPMGQAILRNFVGVCGERI